MWRKYARLIALSHTVFAFPFALWGFILGIQEVKYAGWKNKLLWVVVAVVSARTAALAFNRYADWRIDAQNPRTAQREIPQGQVKPAEALGLTIASTLLFLISSWMLSPLCLLLAPLALLILLGYSYTKRFTFMSHYVLGIALGLAPIGAYVAVVEAFAYPLWLIGSAVMLWVGGFDILYALQDEEFDRNYGLHSIPARLGERWARRISLLSHIIAVSILAWVGLILHRQTVGDLLYWIGWSAFSAFVFYQHWVSLDKSQINRAFFTYNGLASVVFGSLAISSLLLRAY
ncbi:MAG: UbiA-like polyprenyltransferase [Bacteroidia bacterium]|nr:putative 4-hydroxybenzoate polyprenyltransferase [Bacteroidia bacterium]MDW8015137.1 UbiA-like polyprenyltransferase [Bacteroidia bacterium]